MIENNENVKATQELLRHANSKTTLDLYAKAVTPSKRQADERIVNQLLAAQQRISEPSNLQLGGSENEFGLCLGCVICYQSRKSFEKWWPETGSNRRRRPFQGRALPLSYLALGWSKGGPCSRWRVCLKSWRKPMHKDLLRQNNLGQYNKPKRCYG